MGTGEYFRACVCVCVLSEQWNALLREFFLHVYREDESLTPKWQPSTELGRGEAREKREVSDICLFKEKQKRQKGADDTKNKWRERRRERERWALRNHFTMSRKTYRRGPDGLHLVYFCVCACIWHVCVFLHVCACVMKEQMTNRVN